jgi:hypothetical protein
MELKNIYSRKYFIKTNEVFGGTHGGVSASDGFANDAKLKDTLLGKAIDGLFKSIAWLWRKSKEFFVINKLIARLINELMRGVIIYCFEYGVDLTTGKSNKEEKSQEGDDKNDEEGEGSENEEGDKNNVTMSDESDSKLSKEEIEKKIKTIEKVIGEDNYLLINKNNLLKLEEKKLDGLREPALSQQKNKITKIKSEIEEIKKGIAVQEEELLKYKHLLNNYGSNNNNVENEFIKIVNDIKSKYSEFSTDENIESDVNIIKKIKTELDPNDPINKDPEVANQLDSMVNDMDDKLKNVDENEIETIKKELYLFLKNHVMPNYDSYDEEKKKKIMDIYLNYRYFDKLNKSKKNTDSSKDADFNVSLPEISEGVLNEENIAKRGGTGVSASGISKVKMGEHRAGQVGVGKAMANKVGRTIIVKDIITKRDQQKYEEHEEEFDVPVSDINLAEIEKLVQKNGSKEIVAGYVNPENLKVIQLSAQELFASSGGEKENAANNKLQLRWNKELSYVYSSFTNIMDISKVDIRQEYRADLKNVSYKSSVNKLSNLKKIGLISDEINKDKKVLHEKDVKGVNLKTYAFINFSYKEQYFNCVVQPVVQSTIILFKVTDVLELVEGSLVSDRSKFDALFKRVADSDVYFGLSGLRKGVSQSTQTKLHGYLNLAYVFNIKNEQLFICNVDKKTAIPIKNYILNDKKFANDYVVRIYISTCREFEYNSEEVAKRFKLTPYSTPPKFLYVNSGLKDANGKEQNNGDTIVDVCSYVVKK